MNALTIISETIPFLHASSSSDLCGWTETDLYGYLSKVSLEAVLKIAFLVDEYTISSHGTAALTLPATSTRVIDAAFGGSCLELQSPASLHARIDKWEERFDEWPEGLVLEQQGTKAARLFPAPILARPLLILHSSSIPALTSASSVATVQALDVIAGLRTIQEANLRQGDFAFPESAAFADGLASIMEDAAMAYYGGSV